MYIFLHNNLPAILLLRLLWTLGPTCCTQCTWVTPFMNSDYVWIKLVTCKPKNIRGTTFKSNTASEFKHFQWWQFQRQANWKPSLIFGLVFFYSGKPKALSLEPNFPLRKPVKMKPQTKEPFEALASAMSRMHYTPEEIEFRLTDEYNDLQRRLKGWPTGTFWTRQTSE